MSGLKKLIIEVRVNEYASRVSNANVPWTPAEIAGDAAECRQAGASIVHFHGRSAGGGVDLSAASLCDTIARIRADSDILIHPTLGVDSAEGPAESRLAPLQQAVGCNLKPDFAPLDMGTSNIDMLAPGSNDFATESSIYVNTTGTLRYFAGQLRAYGVKPYAVAWNIPMLRWIDAFLAMGVLEPPCFISLGLGAPAVLAVHPATMAGLQAYLSCMPARACEWSVILAGGSLLPMARAIIEQGGHVSIGLGDYAYPELGQPNNAALVREIALIANSCGREIATPADTKEMLGMCA